MQAFVGETRVRCAGISKGPAAARVMIVAGLIMAGAACATEPSPIDGAVFQIEACGDQYFNVLIRDPEVIREAERLIGRADQRIVTGRLRRGNGGFNSSWSWHLLPESVVFADMTIEVCDGCPQFVEDDLDHWIDTVGQYCPWSTRVVQRVR